MNNIPTGYLHSKLAVANLMTNGFIGENWHEDIIALFADTYFSHFAY